MYLRFPERWDRHFEGRRRRREWLGWTAALLVVSLILASLLACTEETRRFREPPGLAGAGPVSRQSPLIPGGPIEAESAPPPSGSIGGGEVDVESAHAVSEGKRLFPAYSRSGFHGRGRGGIAPRMDEDRISGSEPANLVRTILGGRPNGMPTFQGRIPLYRAWQLAWAQVATAASGGRAGPPASRAGPIDLTADRGARSRSVLHHPDLRAVGPADRTSPPPLRVAWLGPRELADQHRVERAQ